jgi:site-specific recombinase XerD
VVLFGSLPHNRRSCLCGAVLFPIFTAFFTWRLIMNRGKKFPANPLTTAEIRGLLSATTGGSLGIRNRAIIYVLWRCGLRVAELCSLKPSDVTGESIRVLKGKRGKARTVGMDVETATMIECWMSRRRERGIDGWCMLFCDLQGEPLHPNGVREMLKRLGKKAGIEKRVHPHAFRHSFAATCARQLPLPIVQNALGHSSLATTSTYVQSLGGEAVDAVRKMVWA